MTELFNSNVTGVNSSTFTAAGEWEVAPSADNADLMIFEVFEEAGRNSGIRPGGSITTGIITRAEFESLKLGVWPSTREEVTDVGALEERVWVLTANTDRTGSQTYLITRSAAGALHIATDSSISFSVSVMPLKVTGLKFGA